MAEDLTSHQVDPKGHRMATMCTEVAWDAQKLHPDHWLLLPLLHHHLFCLPLPFAGSKRVPTLLPVL